MTDIEDEVHEALGLAVVREVEPAPQPVERRSWQPVDLTPVLEGTWKPPEPTVGLRDDGKGLFYPGRGHTVISETEGGKTWFALCAALDEMHAGNHVLYIDFEDDEGGVVGRLLTLGAKADTISGQFHYLRPDAPLNIGPHLGDLREVVMDTRPTIGILDGVTEGMAIHDLNPLDNMDAALFGRMLPRRLTGAGIAVVSLDHVVKDREGRGRYAIGAIHKLNALDGAGYILENRSPFGVGLTGRSTIRISKDRPAQLRKNALSSANGLYWYGDLVLESKGEEFAEISVEPPHEKSESFRPTQIMVAITDLLDAKGPLAQRVICDMVRGRAETVRKAVSFLIADGYISAKTPHQMIKKYDPALDPEVSSVA
jgi:hypothetical protein